MDNKILHRLLIAGFIGLLPLKAVATDPTNFADETPQWWLQRSMQTTSSDSAMMYVAAALNLDPQYAAAYTQRGRIFEQSGEYKKAVKDFSTAIRYAPDYTAAYVEKAKVHIALGQTDKALKCLDNALHFDNTLTEVYQLRSSINLQEGELDAVIYDYSALIALHPNAPRAYLQRAKIYFQLGEIERANLDTETARSLVKAEQRGTRYTDIARMQQPLVALLNILNEGAKSQIVQH